MKYHLATLGLAPLLLAQGSRVRRNTPRLPEPPGARTGITGDGPRLRLLVLGDSAAAGVGASHQDEALAGCLVAHLQPHFCVHWQLLARTGDTVRQVLDHLDTLPMQNFDVVVTSIGVNDVTERTPQSEWLQHYRCLIERLTRNFSVRHVVLTQLPPMHLFPALPQPLRWYLGLRAQQLGQLLPPLAASYPTCDILQPDFSLNPGHLASDGFHPGPSAYSVWARAAAETIKRRTASADFCPDFCPQQGDD